LSQVQQPSLSREIHRPRTNWKTYLSRYWTLYLLLLLPIVFFVVFRYIPMAYILMAFKKNNIIKPPWFVDWAKNNGFEWFIKAFKDQLFLRSLENTIKLNLLDLVCGFPAPILMALVLNELAFKRFKKFTQTVLYLPHFLSWIIIGGMVLQIFSPKTGIINATLLRLGWIDKSIPFLTDGPHWQATYTLIGVWQSMGWGTILYLSAITGINMELFEAAKIDGANKLQQIWHVTLPGIRGTIVILLILNVGQMMNISFDRPYVLGNAMVQNYCDVLSTFVYRAGITNSQFARATAVGLFQSLVGLILISGANFISKKLGEDGIW
jgi:ABC-type polysaccharide transport system, permease component